MSLTENHDPTPFRCAACGSEVILVTQTMFTSAYPGGKVRSRNHQCRRDSTHDIGTLEVTIKP